MRRQVVDANDIMLHVTERYSFEATEIGPIPGVPKTFPVNAAGVYFYRKKDEKKKNGGNGVNDSDEGEEDDGGTNARCQNKPKPPGTPRRKVPSR
jgi:hypothetical protein